MNENYDIDYLLENFASLMGVPARRYENGKRVFFYSLIDLQKDPFLLREKEVLPLEEEIGYILDEDDFYYCYLNHLNTKVVIGPTRNTKASEQCLKLLAIKLDISLENIPAFIQNMSLLSTIPFLSVLQSLTMLDYILTGKKGSVSSFMLKRISKEKEEPLIISEDVNHSSYPIEQEILGFVKRGDVKSLNSFIQGIPSYHVGVLSENVATQEKNAFIVTATLVSRAVIQEGIPIDESLSLSDYYIRKSEAIHSSLEMSRLYYDMVRNFTLKVQQRKELLPLQYKVSCYVLSHLDKVISLEELSSYCNLSKSSLCLKFKNETQKTVNDYIHEVKIEKAKELIDSDLPFSSISYYLGYSSQSHFTKMFEKIAKMSPKEYKQRKKPFKD